MKSIHITEKDVRFEVSRSGGAGGQNVNKRNTQATLYFNIPGSDKLNEQQKMILMCEGCVATSNNILRKIWNRINAAGDIIVIASTERTLEQNKDKALEILNNELNEALTPQKERVAKTPKKVIRKRKARAQKEKLHKYKKRKALKD